MFFSLYYTVTDACPSGWVKLEDHEYCFSDVTERTNQSAAVESCRSINANLAIFTDPSDHYAVREYLNESGKEMHET